jgi:fructokinase
MAMNLVIGEILFDIFPAYRRLGGAPFNVAFHLKHFGLPVRFFSRVGADPEGEEIRKFLADNDFRLDDIQFDSQHPTGKVQVLLDEKGIPQFDIVAEVAYDHLEADTNTVAALGDGVGMIYFGTLIQRTESGRRTLQHLLNRRNPRTQCFYDVNLRPKCYSGPAVQESLRQADHVKLSAQELTVLQDMFGWKAAPSEGVRRLMETNGLKTVSLTRGEAGSELFTAAGHFTAPAIEAADVVDTVGAGDGYAAVLIAGLLQGWRPERMLQQATEFAKRICEIEGAIPTDASFYDRLPAMEEQR